jgi:hypothetical protein
MSGWITIAAGCAVLQVDAAELKTGFDQLTSSNLKLEADAVCMKSAFDDQTALVEKLQVWPCFCR